jgi:hypothetical protein
MRRAGRRLTSGLAAIAVALSVGACTSDGVEISLGAASQDPSNAATASPHGAGAGVEPVHTGEERSAAAMKALCISPESVSTAHGPPPQGTPPAIAEVEDQVEAVRGLDYLERVLAEPVTADRIAHELTEAFDATFPERYYERRTVAWQTMGVIPEDVSIRDALLAFQTGQVVGFYNPVDGELVYIGDEQLDLTERFTLAHELTHAMDDQHFDLSRIDDIAAACQDEAFQAALGTVEGSAQFFATRVVLDFPDPDAGLGDAGGGGLPEGVPPFITELQLWPYSAGQAFITAMDERGNLAAIDGALRRFPVTTEQIMHPERYPSDDPIAIDIPDRSDALGPGWGDLDVMMVGEAWLRAMLALHLDDGEADVAAAGWDGGVYRAWTDGTDSAVLLSTAWDSPGDATGFADAVQAWFDASGQRGSVISTTDHEVVVGFATDDEALDVLRASA